jgi:hypothetical protein
MNHDDDTLLAPYVDAARAVPEASVLAAQSRLSARLHVTQARPPRRHVVRRGGWLAAAAACIAVLVLATGLPFLPGSSDAFAAAQRHFRDFRTLQMLVTTRQDGAVLQTSRTLVDASGITRTDVGDELSIVVDPARGRMLMLAHDRREAMPVPLDASPQRPGEPDWIAELRTFRGAATPIDAPRTIAGIAARGFRLQIGGRAVELWTDADGLPLELNTGAAGLTVDYRFAFDVAVAPGLLSTDVPAGYKLTSPDPD